MGSVNMGDFMSAGLRLYDLSMVQDLRVEAGRVTDGRVSRRLLARNGA